MRKQILKREEKRPERGPGELDIAAIASVIVSSEDPAHPVENAFDGRRGPGASHWRAGEDGEQSVVLAFDSPQKLSRILLEVEEKEVARTQEIQLLASTDAETTYSELVRQEFNFSPPGTTFEREQWQVNAGQVTHLQLRIIPDKSGRPCRAKLTTLALS